MSTSCNEIAGKLFDGKSVTAHPASMIFSNSQVHALGPDYNHLFPVRELSVSPRVGSTQRFISLPSGVQFQCEDNQLLDILGEEDIGEGLAAWLESRISIAVLSLIILLMLLGAGYIYGLPAVAEYAANKIPIESERSLGQQVIDYLDRDGWLFPTRVDAERQQHLQMHFKQLIAGLPYEKHYVLLFRSSRQIGPNAFALPGGILVVTDAMLNLAETNEEVLAVLAHEIGHVEKRHVMRHIIQDSLVAMVIATVTGDAASLGVAVTAIPTILVNAKYSREFESQADTFAFALLKQHDISPLYFADIMRRLARAQGDAEFGFLSTHPVTMERVRAAEQAAE